MISNITNRCNDFLSGTGGVHQFVPADVYAEAEKYAKVTVCFINSVYLLISMVIVDHQLEIASPILLSVTGL